MTCFVICKWNHDHVHAQDDKLGRKKMMKEVDVGQVFTAKEKLQQQRVVDRESSVLVDSLIKDSTGGGGCSKTTLHQSPAIEGPLDDGSSD